MAESPFEAGSEAVALAVTGFAGDHFTVVFHCIALHISLSIACFLHFNRHAQIVIEEIS
jgi:hypothetical protein